MESQLGFGEFQDGQFDLDLPTLNVTAQPSKATDGMFLQNAQFSPISEYLYLPSFPTPGYEQNMQPGLQAQSPVPATHLPFQPQPPIDEVVGGSNSHGYAHMPPPARNASPTRLPRGRRRISTEEWLAQRDNIKHFYLEMGLTLPQTMTAMETSYCFSASEKAYKKKLKEWGFDKNLSQKQARFIRRKTLRRQKQPNGKETEYRLNGNLVAADKIERHCKAHSLTVSAVTGTTPFGLDYQTPSPYPVTPVPNLNTEARPPQTPELSVTDETQSILQLTWHGYNMDALKALHQHALHLGETDQHPVAFSAFMEAIDGLEALMGSTHHSTMNTLSSFVDFCLKCGEYHDEAERRLQKAVVEHQKEFGNAHNKTLRSMARLGTFYHAQRRYGESELMLTRAKTGLEGCFQGDPEDAFRATEPIAMKLIEIFKEQGDFERAEQEYIDLIAISEALKDPYELSCNSLKHDLSHLYVAWKCRRAREGYDDFEMAPPYHKSERLLLEQLDYSEQHRSGAAELFCCWEMLRAQYYDLDEIEKLSAHLARTERHIGSLPPSKTFANVESKIMVSQLKNGIARSYQKLRKYTIAQWWFLHVQQSVEEDLGADAQLAFQNLMHTALFYLEQDQWTEAEPVFQTALQRAERVLEPDDPVKGRIAKCLETRKYTTNCGECFTVMHTDEDREFRAIRLVEQR